MSRINTNVNSLISQRVLGQNNISLTRTLERLSTGFRINRGGDDPAGLIASERLRSEQKALGAAIGNAQRADQLVNTMEGGLQEISSLLLEVQSLIWSKRQRDRTQCRRKRGQPAAGRSDYPDHRSYCCDDNL